MYIDANKFNGWAISESLPHDGIKFDKKSKLEDILIFSDDSDIGYSVEVGLKILMESRKKQRIFLLVLKVGKIILMILLDI